MICLLLAPPMHPLFALFALLLFPSPSLAQIGTSLQNQSSDSTSFRYISTWRSDTAIGPYEAYSNASDASVIFTFIGVGTNYVANSKSDRGLFLLTLDGGLRYTVDLFDNSGYAQGLKVQWRSPTVPYGTHNVTMSQLGIDSRLGFYPYLLTTTWEVVVPTDPAAYTPTEALTTATTGAIGAGGTGVGVAPPPSHSNSHIAPIVGGVVGGIIAILLATFLVYLWKKDRRNAQRGGGKMVQRVKKSEGKMTIEDAEENPITRYGSGYGNGNSWDYRDSASGYNRSSANSGDGVNPGNAGAFASEGYQQQYQNQQRWSQAGSPKFHPSSPPLTLGGGTFRGSGEFGGSENGSRRDSKSYPYLVQGVGSEQRSYPVPEI